MTKPKRIHKPVDLIVANTMHQAVSDLQMLGPLLSKLLGSDDEGMLNEHIARNILLSIARDGDIETVFSALKEAGAPCSMDDIAEGRKAIMERAR